MRERHSARILVISPKEKVLLFHFVHTEGALAGQDYWATPGGGLEAEETFEVAAIRELCEETGIRVAGVGAPVAHRSFNLRMADGEWVTALEQYYVVRVRDEQISNVNWTEEEKAVVADHHWWSREELGSTAQTVWPETLLDMLHSALYRDAADGDFQFE